MKSKLEVFVEDMNEILYEKDPDFEEYPLIFATNGYNGVVTFNGSQLFGFESSSLPTWPEILTEVYNLSKVYASLHKIMKEHFRSMLNKEIEEKYGLGVEKEEIQSVIQLVNGSEINIIKSEEHEGVTKKPTTPLSERDHPMV